MSATEKLSAACPNPPICPKIPPLSVRISTKYCGGGAAMTHVLISYKHEDAERVLPLVRVLEAQKFTVWWDDKISPGKTIPAVIREALDEVSCVVVVWSKLSVKSNWVLDE